MLNQVYETIKHDDIKKPTIILDIIRHVEIDDVLNVWKIETLRSDIGSHEHVLTAVVEVSKGSLSLLLI